MAAQALDIFPILNQLTIPGVVAFVIQQLKVSQHPWLAWITKDTPWVTRVVAAVAAAGTAVGIGFTYTGGTLTITGLTITAVVTGLITSIWHVVQNYLLQHAWYKLAFKT